MAERRIFTRMGTGCDPDNERAVILHGEGDNQVVEYIGDGKIGVTRGPSLDASFVNVAPGSEIRAVGQPEAGFQKVEVVNGKESQTGFVPVP